MAVVAIWKCDRDGSMFENKKDADAYDRMLELGEHFAAFLGKRVDGISEQQAETIGLILANNKDLLITACKGKPDVLLAEPDAMTPAGGAANVMSLAAAAKA